MIKSNNDWQQAILSRFTDREEISKDEVYERFFKAEGLPKEAVLECLNLIEEEYEIPAGILRPDDELTKLIEAVPTKNPFKWLIYQTRAGDKQLELSYQLKKRMKRQGNAGSWSNIQTIEQLIRAWCGQKP